MIFKNKNFVKVKNESNIFSFCEDKDLNLIIEYWFYYKRDVNSVIFV